MGRFHAGCVMNFTRFALRRLSRDGGLAQLQARTGVINQIYSFVGEKTVGDVIGVKIDGVTERFFV